MSDSRDEESHPRGETDLARRIGDSRVRTELCHDLERRLGVDYRVDSASSVSSATAALAEYAVQDQQVALVFADQELGAAAIDFLAQARASHPRCLRVLLISRGDWSSQHPVIGAIALGRVGPPFARARGCPAPAAKDQRRAAGRARDGPGGRVRGDFRRRRGRLGPAPIRRSHARAARARAIVTMVTMKAPPDLLVGAPQAERAGASSLSMGAAQRSKSA